GHFKVRLLAVLGLPDDVHFAHLLYAVADRYIEAESERFRSTVFYKKAASKSKALAQYQRSVADKYEAMLTEITGQLPNISIEGTPLSELKKALIRQTHKALNYTIKQVGLTDDLKSGADKKLARS